MRSKTAGRVLAAVLALGMLFATTAGACAEELAIEGVGSEALTEDEVEVFVTDTAAFDDAAAEDGVITDDEFVFADSEDGFSEPVADAESADEASFYEEEAVPEDADADEEAAEDALSEAENVILEEETSAEETALFDEELNGLIEEDTEVLSEETSDTVSEEALGLSGTEDYGTYLGCDLIVTNLVATDAKAFFKENGIDGAKNYKIVDVTSGNGKLPIATISKKGMITAKNPGRGCLVAYGSDKKALAITPVLTEFYQQKADSKVIRDPYKYHRHQAIEAIEVTDCAGDVHSGEVSSLQTLAYHKVLTYKSSNSKVVAVNEDGELLLKKNGKATVSIYFQKKKLMKLKFNVKLPSIKATATVKPGKSVTLTVKNACAENKVASWGYDGQTVTLTKSGNYNQKCKVTMDQNGGLTCVRALMESGQIVECLVVCSQTKKRVYTDVSFTTQESSYDTKSIKKATKVVNAFRQKQGLRSLKTNKTANVVADFYARASQNAYRPDNIQPIVRHSGSSVDAIIQEIREGNLGRWAEGGAEVMAKATSLGVSIYVFQNSEGETVYLLVLYGVVPAE